MNDSIDLQLLIKSAVWECYFSNINSGKKATALLLCRKECIDETGVYLNNTTEVYNKFIQGEDFPASVPPEDQDDFRWVANLFKLEDAEFGTDVVATKINVIKNLSEEELLIFCKWVVFQVMRPFIRAY